MSASATGGSERAKSATRARKAIERPLRGWRRDSHRPPRARKMRPAGGRTSAAAIFFRVNMLLPLGVADRHPGAHVLLDAVLRERIAKAVLGERFHPGDGLF